MSTGARIDDDAYVAKLLSEDAKKSSLRYAQQGLSALLPRRPTAAAPKPNTRFLKSIVRAADEHNAALKKKEELEARIRQRELRERTHHRRAGGGLREVDERPSKRRRYDDEDAYRPRRRVKEDNAYLHHNTDPNRSRSRDRRDYTDAQARYAHQESGHRDSATRRRRSRSSSESQSRDGANRRSMAGTESADVRQYRRGRPKDQDRASQSINSSGAETKDMARHNAETGQFTATDLGHSAEVMYDSDPLESLVGPLARPTEDRTATEGVSLRSKGRGAYKPSGAVMDAHFSSDYNPTMDLHPESEAEDEKEDWDMALEALRDREMFKQKQAERLREAGFGDAEIKKWEASGKEKDVDDVKWTGKGQAREWDVGKLDQDDRPA